MPFAGVILGLYGLKGDRMPLPKHPLDEAFHGCLTGTLLERLLGDPHVKAAVDKASEAYHRQWERIKLKQVAPENTAEQAARLAFMQALSEQ